MNGVLFKQNLELRSKLARFEPDTLKAGDTLEPFTAAGLRGSSVTVEYTQNSPKRVFMFFSPSCPYSREQFSYWNSVIRQAPAKGLQVIALAKDSEDKSKIEEFLKAVGCPTETDGFQVALIPRQVGSKYKFVVTPTTLVVSSSGVTEYAWNGLWTANDLSAASASLGFDVLHQ
jgi:peroxiredoxin